MTEGELRYLAGNVIIGIHNMCFANMAIKNSVKLIAACSENAKRML